MNVIALRERPGRAASLESAAHAAIQTLYQMMCAHDANTAAHMQRVSELAVQIGRVLGLSDDELETLRRGGLIHDIGKLAIGAGVLNKAQQLSSLERARMERHPVLGEHIARMLTDDAALLPIIRHHHERLDGSGYPDGLIGEEISLLARIVAVADAFDAMTYPRPYRALLSASAALKQLQADAGQLWDAEVVHALRRCVEPVPLAGRVVGRHLAA